MCAGNDAPTTIAASPLELAGVTVHVSDSLRPQALPPVTIAGVGAPSLAALETMPGRPAAPAKRRRIPNTLWGAPIWFWAAVAGLVIGLVAIVLARRPAHGAQLASPPPTSTADPVTPLPAEHVPAVPYDTRTPELVGEELVADEGAALIAEPAEAEHEQGRRPSDGDGTGESMAAAAGPTTLDINTIPAARVFLDGQDTGQRTPIRGLEVTPGRHVVELRVGDASHRYPVVAAPGESVRLFRVLPTN